MTFIFLKCCPDKLIVTDFRSIQLRPQLHFSISLNSKGLVLKATSYKVGIINSSSLFGGLGWRRETVDGFHASLYTRLDQG